MVEYDDLKVGYTVLHLIGQIALLALIITSLASSRVKHSPYLINLFITWLLYSICYSLSIYGALPLTANASKSLLCQIQAAFLHAAAPMCVVAGIIAAIHAWFIYSTASLSYTEGSEKINWTRRILLLSLPYFVFSVFTIASGTTGAFHREDIDAFQNAGLYCTLHMRIFSEFLIPIFSAICLAIIVGVIIALGVQYLLRWRDTSKLFPMAQRRVSISLVARLSLLGIYVIIVITSSVFLTIDNSNYWTFPYITQAGVPLVGFLSFVQEDIISVWCFWKKRVRPPPVPPKDYRSSTLRRSSIASIASSSTLSIEDFLLTPGGSKLPKV